MVTSNTDNDCNNTNKTNHDKMKKTDLKLSVIYFFDPKRDWSKMLS